MSPAGVAPAFGGGEVGAYGVYDGGGAGDGAERAGEEPAVVERGGAVHVHCSLRIGDVGRFAVSRWRFACDRNYRLRRRAHGSVRSPGSHFACCHSNESAPLGIRSVSFADVSRSGSSVVSRAVISGSESMWVLGEKERREPPCLSVQTRMSVGKRNACGKELSPNFDTEARMLIGDMRRVVGRRTGSHGSQSH